MKTLDMTEEQWELQRGCDEIKQKLNLIKQTITLLNGIKAESVEVRKELRNDINKLIKRIYE